MIFKKRNKFNSSISQKNIKNVSSNPKRGWYSIFPFTLPEIPDFTELSYCLNPEESIVLVRVCIKKYQKLPLDNAALSCFCEILDFFKMHQKDIILRVTYDDEGNGILWEPASISLIETHIKQLGEIVHSYSSCIMTTQGIFIGSWGEMHTSRYLSGKELARLFLSFYEAVCGSVSMAVRTPMQLRQLETELKVLSPYNYRDILQLIGLYNDAITASDTDYGTYGDTDSNIYTEKWNRNRELQFQNNLCTGVYNGGEAVHPNPLNDGINAVNTLNTMHITYLNSQHDLSVLDKWKSLKLPAAYGNLSVYDYIGSHLGYCMVLVKAGLDKKAPCSLLVYVRNDGFAALYDEVRLKIKADNSQGESFYFYSPSVNKITIKEEQCFNCDIKLPCAGEYILSCVLERVSDKREITFYNEGLGTLIFIKTLY